MMIKEKKITVAYPGGKVPKFQNNEYLFFGCLAGCRFVF